MSKYPTCGQEESEEKSGFLMLFLEYKGNRGMCCRYVGTRDHCGRPTCRLLDIGNFRFPDGFAVFSDPRKIAPKCDGFLLGDCPFTEVTSES